MSGGLFHGHEESTELFTTASYGQSQSKEAKYHRAYRSDPKNKDRINSQKKRRRALKKESELGSVSSMFESAALPVKAEQQTVVNNHLEAHNNYSISDTWPAIYNFKGEGRLIGGSTREPRRTTQRQTSSGYDSEQDKNELEALRRDIDEIKKCFKPAPSINYQNQEGQDVSGIAIANGRTVAKKKTIAKLIIEKLPAFGLSILILTFLGFNTYFLVSEQQSLYMSMSYSAGMALMIAILSEASLILLTWIFHEGQEKRGRNSFNPLI